MFAAFCEGRIKVLQRGVLGHADPASPPKSGCWGPSCAIAQHSEHWYQVWIGIFLLNCGVHLGFGGSCVST